MKLEIHRTPFVGWTHRLKLEAVFNDPEFKKDGTYFTDVYSNCGDKEQVEQYIKERNYKSVESCKIVHIATKEQDESYAIFIDEVLKDL